MVLCFTSEGWAGAALDRLTANWWLQAFAAAGDDGRRANRVLRALLDDAAGLGAPGPLSRSRSHGPSLDREVVGRGHPAPTGR